MIIILILAFAWLLIETDYMRVRLPVGTFTHNWTDELPYEIGYQDTDFADDLLPVWKWKHTDAQYQAWLRTQNTKLVYCPVDMTIDYPQYQDLQALEDLDKRRHGEMIYQRGR